MQEFTIEEAQSHLAEIIAGLSPGTEFVIVDGRRPVAVIRAFELLSPRKIRQLGTLKGSVTFMADDFDALPEGFEDAVG